MMLKNRLTALVAVAAIAVPAVVFAAGKFSKVSGKGSVINVEGQALGGIHFTAVASDNAITITDDGTTIKVAIDGHKMKTGSETRDTHMKEQVFAKGKTIALTVTHADLDAGLPKGKVKGTLQFSDKPGIPIEIEGATLKDGVVKGKFSTTRTKLQVPKACMPPFNKPCTEEPLVVDATLYVSQ